MFLGQTDAREVGRIADAVKRVAARHFRYEVSTGEGGGRAKEGRGGVAWLRLTAGERETTDIALELDRALDSRTYDARRMPRPHLTLARSVDQATLDDLHALARDLTVRWTADRLVLLRSHADPGGSRYEELAAYDLVTGS